MAHNSFYTMVLIKVKIRTYIYVHTYENLTMFPLGVEKVLFISFMFLYLYPLVNEYAFLLYT